MTHCLVYGRKTSTHRGDLDSEARISQTDSTHWQRLSTHRAVSVTVSGSLGFPARACEPESFVLSVNGKKRSVCGKDPL